MREMNTKRGERCKERTGEEVMIKQNKLVREFYDEVKVARKQHASKSKKRRTNI